MKKTFLFIFALVAMLAVRGNKNDEQLIRETIQSAYVDGIHNRQGIDKIEQGFHLAFEMLVLRNGLLNKFPIAKWIESVKKSMQEQGEVSADNLITAKYPHIDISGDAAVAKVELFRGDKQLFADYMFLYKVGDEWLIVSKIYYRIPN
jgi:hypothetical protein